MDGAVNINFILLNFRSCSYCIARKESGGATRLKNHLAGLQGDVVPRPNVPRFVRRIMLDKDAQGRKRRADTKEHRLYVQKAIQDEAYEDYKKDNIPRGEQEQVDSCTTIIGDCPIFSSGLTYAFLQMHSSFSIFSSFML